MSQLSDQAPKPDGGPVLFAYGFRPFFLGAGIYALLAMLGWLASHFGLSLLAHANAVGHGHEMLIGYAVAVLAGFLLTAVPSWTGGEPIRGARLAVLFGLWLAGRIAFWFAPALPSVLVAVADLVFLPALALMLIAPLVRAEKKHNLVFVLLLLLLTAVISIVLGMGMPTTAIYVLLALMVAPPLIELGVDPLAAHLFVLYFGLMSMITPPVALAAFTGAKLANANPMSTAVTACRIGWVAYVIPFVFVFSPPLIMKGSPVEVIVTFFTAVLGVWIASAGFLGYLFQRLGALSRVIFITVGLALLVPLGFVESSWMIRLTVAFFAVALLGKEFLASASVKEKGPLAGRVE